MKVEALEFQQWLNVDMARGSCLVSGLEPGEPIFVLRARDAVALPMLNLYRHMTDGMFDSARSDALSRLRREFQTFAEHSSQLRFPD